MSAAPLCLGCGGKFPLLGQGVIQCDVCFGIARINNLVKGSRFPGGLSVVAARCLHTCYLQLLQEADQFFANSSVAGGEPPGGFTSGSGAAAPATPAPEPTAATHSDTPGKDLKDKAKEKDKKKSRKREEEDKPPKATSTKKEKKLHPKDEPVAEGARDKRVKVEEADEERLPLAHVPAGEEYEEGEESEEVSPSKSPLPRRRVSPRRERPASPPGYPPWEREERADSRRPAHTWVGPIPAARSRQAEGGAPSGLPGLGAKSRAQKKKKKKNKGKKHAERQERRRQDRERRGR